MRSVALTLAVALALVGCGDDGDDEARQPPTTTDPGFGPLGVVSGTIAGRDVALAAEPDPPRAGAPVTWRFTVSNPGDEALALTFSSGQRGDVVLARDGEEAYRWSDGQVFTQAIEEVTIGAGTEEVFELAGTLDVEPGVYELTAELTADPGHTPLERTVEVAEAD